MMKNILSFLTLLALLSLLFVQDARTQTPRFVTVQGVAIDSKGTPLPDGNQTINFKVYDSATREIPLWSEQQEIAIKDGHFSATLGSINPFTLPDDNTYWLGMTVGQGEELSPRLQLKSDLQDSYQRSRPGLDAVGDTLIVTFIDGDTGNLNLTANVGGEVTINHASEDVNFRVEGDTEPNLLFVDAGNDRIGIGSDAPGATLEVAASGSDVALKTSGTSSNIQAVLFNTNNSNNSTNAVGVNFTPTMLGSGAGMQGISYSPVLSPSGNISVGYGALAVIRISNSSSNIGDIYGNFYKLQTTPDYTGTINNAILYQVNPPTWNGSKPTNMTAIRILNQGAPGMNIVRGLQIQEQTGGITNRNISSEGPSSINYFEGSIGIGESNPQAKLVVRSDTGTNLIEAYNDADLVFRVERGTGNVYADGSFNGGGADVAEYVDTSEAVEPGDVIEIDPDNPGKFRKAKEAKSPRVAGIITTSPGVVLGNKLDSQAYDDRPAVALAGRVPVKVMAKFGAIEIGDLLVSSPFPGYAMKCSVPGECIGAVVGKAMEPLHEGVDKIMAQVMLR